MGQVHDVWLDYSGDHGFPLIVLIGDGNTLSRDVWAGFRFHERDVIIICIVELEGFIRFDRGGCRKFLTTSIKCSWDISGCVEPSFCGYRRVFSSA